MLCITSSVSHASTCNESGLVSFLHLRRGGRVDTVIPDAVASHTLIDIVVAELTRGDLVERAARIDLVAALNAEWRKEAHCRDRTSWNMFIPFALETYGALSARSDRFFVDCASLASRGCAGSGPSSSMLCSERQLVPIALRRSLAHAIHARFLRLE